MYTTLFDEHSYHRTYPWVPGPGWGWGVSCLERTWGSTRRDVDSRAQGRWRWGRWWTDGTFTWSFPASLWISNMNWLRDCWWHFPRWWWPLHVWINKQTRMNICPTTSDTYLHVWYSIWLAFYNVIPVSRHGQEHISKCQLTQQTNKLVKNRTYCVASPRSTTYTSK